MPLIKSPSKKAFSKNVEAEMSAGKPQKQSLAISYDVKRKNARKKMAQGGAITVPQEKRPMPEQKANDMAMVSRNSAKAPMQSPANADQNPRIPRPKTQPIKHPRMVPSNAFSIKLRDEEDHLQRMADGGHVEMERGPMPEEDEVQHPAGLESDNDMMGDDDAMSDHNEMLAEGGSVSSDEQDMPENNPGDAEAGSEQDVDDEEKRLRAYAEGGMIDLDEMEDEKHSSIAAAIMAKRHKMADGGQVDIEENNEEQPNQYYDANEAVLKENYDDDMSDIENPMSAAEHGDEIDSDAHDMISAIRSRMNKRRMR